MGCSRFRRRVEEGKWDLGERLIAGDKGGNPISVKREIKDRWLTRGLLIEGIFLGFFIQWYISRYYGLFGRLELEVMIPIIFVLSVVVVLIGWLYDRKYPYFSLEDGEESK